MEDNLRLDEIDDLLLTADAEVERWRGIRKILTAERKNYIYELSTDYTTEF